MLSTVHSIVQPRKCSMCLGLWGPKVRAGHRKASILGLHPGIGFRPCPTTLTSPFQRTGTDGHGCTPPTHFPTQSAPWPQRPSQVPHRRDSRCQNGPWAQRRIIQKDLRHLRVPTSEPSGGGLGLALVLAGPHACFFDDTRTGRRSEATEALEPSAPFRWGGTYQSMVGRSKAGTIHASRLNGWPTSEGVVAADACVRTNQQRAHALVASPPGRGGVHIRPTMQTPTIDRDRNVP